MSTHRILDQSLDRMTASRCPSKRTSLAPLVLVLSLSIVISSLGCAFGEFRPGDPFDRQYTLDEAQHRYTTLVRFSEFEKARNFVVEDERDAFMTRMKALKDARFTDYESEIPVLDAAKATATIVVTYTIYTPTMPYEIEVSETQVWTRDKGLSNTWRVHSTFEGLQEVAAN